VNLKHCDEFDDLIRRHAEEDLAPADRARLDQHLRACDACRDAANQLRQIRLAAAGLDRVAPPAGLWPGVASRLEAEIAARRTSPRHPTWRRLAVAAVLVAMAGGAFVVVRQALVRDERPGSSAAAPPAPAEASGALVTSVESELRLAAEHYENAIAGLEQIAASQEGALDPNVAATLRKNLAVIDQAINESRAALEAQPASQPAQESLFTAFRHKIGLLQDTIALINEMRKGDSAGAARVVEGLRQ
jgi:hypothetical protein